MTFDEGKDAENLRKHGVSLAAAADLDIRVIVDDPRFTEEARHRAYGYLSGAAYCLAFTIRNGSVRPISLRRAHAKEMRKHGADDERRRP